MARERLSFRILVGVGIFVAIILGLLAFLAFAFVWTEYEWFASLGHQSVIITRVISQVGVWLLCTVIASSIFYATACTGRLVSRSAVQRPAFAGVDPHRRPCPNIAGNWMTFRLRSSSRRSVQWSAVRPRYQLLRVHAPALELLNTWFNGLIFLCAILVFGRCGSYIRSFRLTTVAGRSRHWSRACSALS
jgi:hypothetical protein